MTVQVTPHSVPTTGCWRMYIRRPIGSCVRSFSGRGGDTTPGTAGSPRRQGGELQQLEDSTPQRDPEYTTGVARTSRQRDLREQDGGGASTTAATGRTWQLRGRGEVGRAPTVRTPISLTCGGVATKHGG